MNYIIKERENVYVLFLTLGVRPFIRNLLFNLGEIYLFLEKFGACYELISVGMGELNLYCCYY